MRMGPAGGLQYDVAVIGAGLAGTVLALSLDPRLSVGVFSKGSAPGGASGWAQGGLAAVVAAEDSIEDHVADTLAAGAGLCDEDAVREIVSQGPASVDWLGANGVEFTRSSEGSLDLHREGGHGRRRIVHASDATGAAILAALAPQLAARPGLVLHAGTVAVDLAVADGRVCGCYVLERASGQVRTVAARAVVLATGGAGKVYRYTTNPDDSTGDGIAMAWRAGCAAVNMEFVQFHPTALFHPAAKAVLVSEAARGEGAKLVNRAGERFMDGVHPQAELAPRDIVARAIDTEMKRSGEDCVFLDFRHLPAAALAKFPSIAQRCAQLGIDMASQPVPVVPSAHYLCGGVRADCAGSTELPGLFVAGEVAHTGLHGANRLASNSLLECVAVARSAAARIPALRAPAAAPRPWDASRVGPSHEEVMVAHNWDEIRRMMWNYVGIVRSDERLARAARRLAVIAEEVDDHYRRFVISPDFADLRNLLLCAKLIVEAAASRRESRGLHFSVDCQGLLPHAANTVLQRSGASASVAEVALDAN